MTLNPTEKASAIADVLDIVDSVAGQLARRLPAHVSIEDLASAGKEALIRAIDGFEGSPGDLRRYCASRVRGAMLDALRGMDPLSRHFRGKLKRLRRAVALLETRLGRSPTQAEIGEETGLSPSELRTLERLATSSQRADDIQMVRHKDDEGASPAEVAEAGDALDTIRQALSKLPAQQAFVARRCFMDESSCETIAAEIGLSAERVRQLRVAAAEKLRRELRSLVS